MSGTGHNDFLAPTRLTPVAADQPIGQMVGGQVMPSMFFSQMIQRILAYLGQPAQSADGQTLTDQVIAIGVIADTALQTAQSAASVAISVAAGLEQKLAQNATTAELPVNQGVPDVVNLVLPLAPPFGVTPAQLAARVYFGF